MSSSEEFQPPAPSLQASSESVREFVHAFVAWANVRKPEIVKIIDDKFNIPGTILYRRSQDEMSKLLYQEKIPDLGDYLYKYLQTSFSGRYSNIWSYPKRFSYMVSVSCSLLYYFGYSRITTAAVGACLFFAYILIRMFCRVPFVAQNLWPILRRDIQFGAPLSPKADNSMNKHQLSLAGG